MEGEPPSKREFMRRQSYCSPFLTTGKQLVCKRFRHRHDDSWNEKSRHHHRTPRKHREKGSHKDPLRQRHCQQCGVDIDKAAPSDPLTSVSINSCRPFDGVHDFYGRV